MMATETGRQDPRAEGEWKPPLRMGERASENRDPGGWAAALPGKPRTATGVPTGSEGGLQTGDNLWRREGRWLDEKCLELLGCVCAAGAGEGQRGRSWYREGLGKRTQTGAWGGEHRCSELFVLLESEFSLRRDKSFR